MDDPTENKKCIVIRIPIVIYMRQGKTLKTQEDVICDWNGSYSIPEDGNATLK